MSLTRGRIFVDWKYKGLYYYVLECLEPYCSILVNTVRLRLISNINITLYYMDACEFGLVRCLRKSSMFGNDS
jgi:hypothetical protein